ncbi:ABC transporter ATP-binding protein [Niallia sp. 01092]|uniref:ABC transporter ATP-binding protein n=1 Tax=unclassified Niallia TaxID=2837522 RepID=UPI003FD4C468
MSTVVHNVSKKFDQSYALSSIDLTINDGEFVAILGPSGCGKSTLLRLLAGFDSPTDGEILMNGKLVAQKGKRVPPEQRNIGMVFQSFALWPHLKVKEQIHFPLKHHHFVEKSLKKKANERVDEMLSLVGLKQFGDRMPNDLSGGQKQRVAIARALAPKPSLLLMDEPLSSLDAELRMDLRNEIQMIHQKTNTSIVYVTHDQSEALAMADRIVVMKEGQVEQVGTPEEIYMMPKTTFVASFVGKANILKGEWNDNIFHPFGDRSLQWTVPYVSENLYKQNLCPIRPEQLFLSKNGTGVEGVIRNVLFQGREMHYTVEVKGILIHVHGSIANRFTLGDQVFIQIKQHTIQNDLPVNELGSEMINRRKSVHTN